MRRTPLASLTTSLAVVASLGLAAPVSAAPAGPRVVVSKVVATERPTSAGTRVTVSYSLRNNKADATPPRRVKLTLINAVSGSRRWLGSAPVPSLAPGAIRRFTTTRLVGPHVVEGDYRTRVCYTRKPGTSCATSSAATVTILPASLQLSDDVVVVPFTPAGSGSERAVTDSVRVRVTNAGQARSGLLSLSLEGAATGAGDTAARAPSTAFTIAATTCEASLAAGEQCSIDIARTAESAAASTAVLTVTGRRGSSATGYLVGPVRVVPVAFDFGDVKAFTDSAPQVLSLVNGTDAPLQVPFGFVGSDVFSFDFSAPEFTCDDGAPVPAGGSCTVTVRFRPNEAGPQTASGSLFTTVGTADFYLVGSGLPGAEAPGVQLRSSSQFRSSDRTWGASR